MVVSQQNSDKQFQLAVKGSKIKWDPEVASEGESCTCNILIRVVAWQIFDGLWIALLFNLSHADDGTGTAGTGGCNPVL